jgi:hypothetical protein
MPAWIALAFAAYTTHFLWQAKQLLAHLTWQSWFLVPLVLAKLGFIAASASYWFPSACEKITKLNQFWFILAFWFALLEARIMYAVIAKELHTLRAGKYFYPAIVLQLGVSVALPILLLGLLGVMIFLGQCAR